MLARKSIFVLTLLITQAEARVYRTFPEAIQSVFPQADNLKRRSVYLTPEQLKRAAQAPVGLPDP